MARAVSCNTGSTRRIASSLLSCPMGIDTFRPPTSLPWRVAALLAAMPQEHERALGAWQAELAEWPLLLMAVHGSARAMAGALPRLRLDPARMRANLDAMRVSAGRETADTWFDPALVTQAGVLARAQLAQLHQYSGE